MYFKQRFFYSLILLISINFLFAQNPKQEQETRISSDEFPSNALTIVQDLNDNQKKVKFYLEVDGASTSYEAKFKRIGQRISVEFDKKGMIQDIEVRVAKRTIDKTTLERIHKSLDTVARKYRIEKVQKQYLFNTQDLEVIRNKLKAGDFENYELIVAFKDKRKIYRREYQFSCTGVLLSFRDIKRLEYDFLLF